MAANDKKPHSLWDGVINPSGFAVAGAIPVFAAFVPVTGFLTKPEGVVSKAVAASLNLLPGSVSQSRVIPALAAIYFFAAVPITGALSVGGQAASRHGSLDNNHPRAHRANMRGLPLRIHSAHQNILENFPAWALAAALTQTLAPGDAQLVNLLGLAALSKIFVYWPAYVFDIAPLRSVCHLIHTSAVFNVLYKIALGA